MHAFTFLKTCSPEIVKAIIQEEYRHADTLDTKVRKERAKLLAAVFWSLDLPPDYLNLEKWPFSLYNIDPSDECVAACEDAEFLSTCYENIVDTHEAIALADLGTAVETMVNAGKQLPADILGPVADLLRIPICLLAS